MTERDQSGATNTALVEVNTWIEQASTVNTVLAPRDAKAVAIAIATDAGQWLKCRTRDGRKAYGIRSSRDANLVHLVTRTSCTCYDGQRRTCKHQLAVQLHCQLVAEQRPISLARILDKPQRHTSGPFTGLPVTPRFGVRHLLAGVRQQRQHGSR